MKKLLLVILFFLLAPIFPAKAAEDTVRLPVPFYWEIPDGVWVPPWSGACEEASIVAAEGYYLKKPKKIVPRDEAKSTMAPLFGIENKLFGYNTDTDAKETSRLINEYTSFDSVVKENPTLEEIKAELKAGRPVITMHYGYDLKNPRHRFRRGGSSYHVMTLTGYDDSKNEFFVNDSELNDGIDLRYKYDIIMSSLRDFNHKTKKADGPKRVVFTMPKTIVKPIGGSRIYLIRDGVKHHITSPAVFKNRRWSWSLVKPIQKSELEKIKSGAAINS